MSCLNLKRLLSHRKVWKLLRNKLPLKLIRSSSSKANKKPKHRSYKTSKKVSWPSLSIQPKKFKKQPNLHTIIHHKNHHCCVQRRPPPVFIDQLFVEPVSVVREHVVSPGQPSKESLKKSEILDRESSRPASSNDRKSWPESCKEERGVIDDEYSMVNADDAWESMAVASPQMHGINERAEEFIARFRADMRQQEILARRL
ncbi:hypothetical protein C2S52_022464 [Perilla frutescens var. hirtella]|nr:hypothetical protein C2S52_022464 [Perilla frutescens var. hirtella]